MLSTAMLGLIVALALTALVARRRLGRGGLVTLATVAAAAVAGWVVLCGTYDLRKVLGTLAMPAGLVWLGMIGFAWWLGGHRRRSAAVAAWILAGGLTVAGSPLVGHALRAFLERPFVAADPFAGPPLEAVVVLGGGIGVDPRGRPALGAAGDRVLLGARLLAAGRTELLVTTGPVLERAGHRFSVPVLTAELWTELGLPSAAVVRVEGPRTTAQEMDAVQRLAAQRGWGRIGVVTSGYHMRRALGLARRRGLDPVPLPADMAGAEGRFEPRRLIPSGAGFETVHVCCWELLGMLVSR